MTELTFADAAARVIVRLPDGRTGRLFAIPREKGGHRSIGRKARVEMPSGAMVSVPLEDLQRVVARRGAAR